MKRPLAIRQPGGYRGRRFHGHVAATKVIMHEVEGERTL